MQQEARDAAVSYFKQPSKAADEFALCLALLVVIVFVFLDILYLNILQHPAS
jgi:hypothetical protein